MVKKEEGKVQDCWQCGEEIICRSVEYQGNTTLQWQNEEGGAHYKFISPGNYECKTSDYDTPSTASNPATLVTKTMSMNDYAIAAQRKIGDQILETKRLQGQFKELVDLGELVEGTTEYSIIKLYIRMIDVCDKMVITDEIKRGMLSNQANIRASG